LIAYQKLSSSTVPAALLYITGLGALVINLFCAFLLAKFRKEEGGLIQAAFLSARNDALISIAIIITSIITLATASPWPDLAVGLGIFLINLDAAREVFNKSKEKYAL
jgi:Co/Zn/Cd efflux system component